MDDVIIVVENGKILHAGPAVDRPLEGATVEMGGATILPGFIDAHVHIGFFPPLEVLVGGVTTVRDLAWPPDEIWPLVERAAAPDFEGPHILAAGQMLTAPGGYPTEAAWAPPGTGYEVASTVDAREAVDRQLSRGASVIKIALNPPAGPTLPAAVLDAIVIAAHDHGARVTGHVHGLAELIKALDAGIDELAHMLMSDEMIPDEVISRLVEQDVTIVPTLSVRFEDRSVAIENTSRFLAAGGRVVYGTDLGNEGPGPGIDKREVEALSSAGMGVRDIIRAATADAADYLGLDRKGAIEAGRDADLVAVGPLENPVSLTEIKGVWRGGRRAG
jgi:imidazolonepropionase-like amidohydrolase